MSRLSQYFWAVNRDEYPDAMTKAVRYTDIEFTEETDRQIKAHRKWLKAVKKYKEKTGEDPPF